MITESPPIEIDNLLDELEELPPDKVAGYIRTLAVDECYWLAGSLRRRAMMDRELAPEEISIEMKVCY